MVSYQSAKEEIKRSADIVELIGEFVQLRKAGRNHVGLCPFHAEKDPSFTVTPERQTFHCFGCKKGGDIFSFWMEYHSSTFQEALRDLAERYHVTISEGFSAAAERENTAKRDALFKINEKAADYFQRALSHPVKGGTARDYLNGRSISKETISEFRLGYAPDEWDGLIGFLRHDHMGLDKAAQAGLIIPKKNGGYYDRFRCRIIFPIFDLRQKVVGFGGRVLDDSLPKYLNTPETPIFHKGEFLYGLHASLNAIRKKHRAVIVEGYMDWLALRKHGLGEVVATLGTALTAKHVRKLKGYSREAVVVFDSDEAGKAAVLKSLPIFSNEGLSARAVVLPDGHDPDSFVNENGLTPFLELLDQASAMLDFYLEQKLTPTDSDEEKVRVLKEILPVLSEIRDFTLRSLYVRRVSERAGIKEEIVWFELKRFVGNPPGKTVERNLKQGLASSGVAKRYHNDVVFLNLLIHYPHTVPRLMDCEWRILFSDPVIVEVVDTFFEKYHQEGHFPSDDLVESLDSEAARNQFREALLQPPIYSDDEVELCVDMFEERVNEIKRKASVQSAGKRGDFEGLNELLKAKIAKSLRGLGT